MANRWGIPMEVEVIVLKRDLRCVYCGQLIKTKPAYKHLPHSDETM
jgi:hypothetical protein